MVLIDAFLDALDDDKEYEFINNCNSYTSHNELKIILLEYIKMSHMVPDNHSNVADIIANGVREDLVAREVFE